MRHPVPTFNNRHNEQTKTPDGRTVWLSRSVAVCVCITAVNKQGEKKTILSRRGKLTPNLQGHMNLICGYMDWDETLNEGARRETWEETGFNVLAIPEEDVLYSFSEEPWGIDDRPKGSQNITIRYGMVFKVDSWDVLPELTDDYSEPEEVEDLQWMSHDDVLAIKDRYEDAKPYEEHVWAFNHYDVYRLWDKIVDRALMTGELLK